MEKLIKPNRLLLEKYCGERQLNDKTIQNYIYLFYRIQELLKLKKIKPPVLHKNVDAILEVLEEQYLLAKESDFKRLVGLKAVICEKFLLVFINVIKNKHDNDKITDAIELYTKRQTNYTATKSKNQLNDIDMSYDEMVAVMAYPQNSSITDNDYILLYILINLGTRNMDLTCVHLQERPPTENYLYIDDDGVAVYVRNRYKLYTTFGTLTNKIDDKRFIESLNNINETNRSFLFMNKHGKPYKTDTISAYIKSQTKKIYGVGLTESVIYKISMAHFKNNDALERQIALAKTRPHTIQSQSIYYE